MATPHSQETQHERNPCLWPWLDTELEAVRPELIVYLGATAAQSLLGSSFRITQSNGKGQRGDGLPLIIASAAGRCKGLYGKNWKSIPIPNCDFYRFGASALAIPNTIRWPTRANYQLTLTYLFAAKDAEASDTAKAKWLSSAIGSFCVLSDPEVLVSSNRRTDEYADLDLYVRAQLHGCRLICELVRFDSFWAGEETTKLLKRLELVPSLKRFSGSLASLLASTEREMIAQSPIRLLREAWCFLDTAKTFDTKLRGTRADRSALIIARVELICLNLEYCRTLSPDVVAPELWNEVETSIVQSSQELAEAQKTLRALLEDNSPLSSKKQASLYMAYAKTLLLSGATAEARKQMAFAADRLARGVEDRILHDEMEHLKQRMPPLQDQITLSLYSDGQQIPGKELENQFLAKLVQIANEEGLSLKETAARYHVDKDTITNWCKRGHYIWRDK